MTIKTNKLNKVLLFDRYRYAIQNAKLKNDGNHINDAIKYCEYAGLIAWYYPIFENFFDNELENLITSITNKFSNLNYQPIKNRIVFYNSQIIDNGALTEQYLDFFIKYKYELLFIVKDKQSTRLGKHILAKISNAPNIKLYISKESNRYKKITELQTLICNYRPSVAYLHFVPNDVVACCVFLKFKNLKTHYIVHNDHTFWIGKNFFDYYIEFRQFGISLAIERRCISLDKILHIPYYPINNKVTFKGFPFDRKDKVVGVSGANLYKYLIDSELRYFEIIKELIEENENFVFCLAGWGDDAKILSFITKNKLENRFYFLGRRSDFYSLIGHCDILFESYPLKGGLTPLFATEQKIPCVGISTSDNASGSLEELLNIDTYKQPTNLEAFKAEATRLIQSVTYRRELGLLLSKNKCNKDDFENALKQVINNDFKSLKPKNIKPLLLNDENNLNEYLNLSSSTYEELMRHKLFVLKSSLSYKERIKTLSYAIKANNTKSLYDIVRLLCIVFFGK